MLKEFEINGIKVGINNPPYIVAEVSANHNGDINKAINIISEAKNSGASAVKLQTYTPDTITIDSKKSDFLIKEGLWKGYSLYELYKEAHTPFEWHETLLKHAKEIGITCFSSPFDESAVDLLEDLNVPAYKVASFELVDLPLIKYIASTKKPMIMSTGLANLQEIKEAISTASNAGCERVIILHCVSGYPTPTDQYCLKTIPFLQQELEIPIGLSDHTLSSEVSLAAVAMGAVFIEKHFTHSRKDEGADSSFSLEPEEFSDLVNRSKIVYGSLGDSEIKLQEAEKGNLQFRRSIYIVDDMKKGQTFSKSNVRRIRPGFGLEPKFYEEILGRKIKSDVEKGTPLNWDLIE